MLLYDDIYSWEGWGGRLRLASGKCHLRIFDLSKGDNKELAHLKPMVVIASDVAESTMTVRSCAGHIATKVTAEFNIDSHRMLFIDYTPSSVYGEHGEHRIEEQYDVADFTWNKGKAMHPRWRPLQPQLLDIIRDMVENKKK